MRSARGKRKRPKGGGLKAFIWGEGLVFVVPPCSGNDQGPLGQIVKDQSDNSGNGGHSGWVFSRASTREETIGLHIFENNATATEHKLMDINLFSMFLCVFTVTFP